MKKCIRCHEDKPEEDYLVRNKKTGNRGSVCKNCRAIYHKTWHHSTKEQRREKRARYKLVSRQRLVQVVVEYLLAHPCVDCGESDPIVLDFDHIRDKEMSISDLLRCGSRDRVLEEIKKCEVRCANCHRRKTAQRGGWNIKGLLAQ